MPRVSVILPVFNAERFLAEALQSVRAQTFRDFELIVIDDGSSDRSFAIAETFVREEPRAVVVRQENRGLVAALNRGLAMARGELIARFDQDDVCLPQRLERQVAYLDAHPEVAVVGCNVTFIDEAGRVLRDFDFPLTPQAAAAQLATGSPLAHPTVVMRRAVIEAVGGYRPAFEHAEDYDLWLRVAERAQLANVGERLLLYRQHGDNMTRRYAAQQMLAGRFARLSAEARRAGRPDPFATRTEPVSIADVDVFEFSRAERAELVFNYLNLLVGCYSVYREGAYLTQLAAAVPRFEPQRGDRSRNIRLLLAIARDLALAGRLRPALASAWKAAAADPLVMAGWIVRAGGARLLRR
jgi:glycosyltransferase involved in cell wall biosynthesis